MGNDPGNHTDPSGKIIDTIADIAFVAYDIYELATEPSWTNAGALGADIAGVFIPVATGLGAGVRGAAKGAEKIAADSARAANTARGRASEARKLEEIGATRNTDKVATSTGDRIRDGTKADGTHVEVKDTKRLDNTKQVEDWMKRLVRMASALRSIPETTRKFLGTSIRKPCRTRQ